MSHYDKVKEFNTAFQLDTPSEPLLSIFDDQPQLVRLKLDLIIEEVEELKEAIQKKDMVEVADALGDILYVVHGAGIAFGLNTDRIFSVIHESNMSKLCDTEDIAKKTVASYKQKFKLGQSPYDTPVYRYNCRMQKYIVYNQSTGKILKSVYYNPVDFHDMTIL